MTSRTGLRSRMGSSKAASSHPHCSLSINDFVEDINTAGLGIHCKENIISSLLFADDLVILAENEMNLQGIH